MGFFAIAALITRKLFMCFIAVVIVLALSFYEVAL